MLAVLLRTRKYFSTIFVANREHERCFRVANAAEEKRFSSDFYVAFFYREKISFTRISTRIESG